MIGIVMVSVVPDADKMRRFRKWCTGYCWPSRISPASPAPPDGAGVVGEIQQTGLQAHQTRRSHAERALDV